MKPIAAKLPDGLREALGYVIAHERRQWQRERELIEAQSRQIVAELRAEVIALRARVDEQVAARLATVKDGEPGQTGADGRQGEQGQRGERGEPGRDGANGAPGERGEKGDAGERGLDGQPGALGAPGVPGRDGVDGRDGAPGEKGAEGERGPQGERGEPGERGPEGPPGRDGRDAAAITDEQIDAAVARYLAANPPPAGRDGEPGEQGQPGRDGADGKDGRDGIDGQPGRDGVDGASGRDGQDGAPGERGPEGLPGKLPTVVAWSDRVHYEGAVVTHGGATYQAQRDTGREPPHEDWRCIAAAGRPGRDGETFRVRGTWSTSDEYRHLDVVALNGAAFVARHDEPGQCPGEGWQIIAMQGKGGRPGEPGRGTKGDRGDPGMPVVAIDVDSEGMLTLTNGDGSIVTCDLYPILSKLR